MAEHEDEIQLLEEPEEDEVYIQYEIATYPADHTLSGIVEMWERGDLIIPDYQRNFVWSIKQSSLLVESFLLGLPVPPAFFYVDENNTNEIIDGQQRILSIIFYFDGYFGPEGGHGRRKVFRLSGLSDKSPYNNLKFEDLLESDQRKLRNSVLRSVNVRQLSPNAESTSVYHIFERLNTGGTPLKPQEIRNCVYRGEVVTALRALNEDPNWRKILGRKQSDRHQKDVELILRLFSLFEDWRTYEKPMKEYLNVFMGRNRSFNSAKAKRFLDIFPKACELIVKQLGERPFSLRGPLNTSVLDSVMCVVLNNIGKKTPEFKARFDKLTESREFRETITGGTTDTAMLHNRMSIAFKILAE